MEVSHYKGKCFTKDSQEIHLLLFAAFIPKKASQCLNKPYAFRVKLEKDPVKISL